MRWNLTAEEGPPTFTATAADAPPAETPTEAPEAEPDSPAGRFHAVIIREGTWTGDGRFFAEGGGTWREENFPLTGNDTIRPEHEDAMVAGHFDRLERQGAEIHGWGPWATTPDAVHLRGMVRSGDNAAISAIVDSVDYEILIPPFPEEDDLATDPETGELILPGADPRMRALSYRVIGATIVPYQAVDGLFIEDLNPEVELVAEVAPTRETGAEPEPALVAAGGPMRPPLAWFGNPRLAGPSAMTITDAGELIGHLALDGVCHVGRPGCVTAPHSFTNYAHFHTGELVTAEGVRVAVGQITLRGGHADDDPAVTLDDVRAHYDDTDSAVADVTVGEDEFGIWVHGAVRPGVSNLTMRRLMASDISGDWRRIGGHLELVAVLCVNSPGFPRPRTLAREESGQVVALVASLNPITPEEQAELERIEAARERLAAMIGRSTTQRIEALTAAVHPVGV